MTTTTTWIVSYNDGRGWIEYDRYTSAAEATKVARFLRKHGNVVRIDIQTNNLP